MSGVASNFDWWLNTTLGLDDAKAVRAELRRIDSDVPALPTPEALRTTCGGLLLVWTLGGGHAELERRQNGQWHWLVLDELAVKASSGDEPRDSVDASFHEALRVQLALFTIPPGGPQ